MKPGFLILCLLIIMAAVAGCTIREYRGNSSDPTGCPVRMTRCGEFCADLELDIFNCGSCNHHCPFSGECINGTCRCREGEVVCNNVCRNLQTSVTDCGSCGHMCGSREYCVRGWCASKY